MIARILGGFLAAALGVIAFLLVQTFGLSLGPIGIEGDRKHIARLQHDLASIASAQAEAKRLQYAADLAAEAHYSVLAKDNAHAHREALSGVRSAISAYSDMHRLTGRVCDKAAGGASLGPAAAGVPANPASPAGDAALAELVVVTRGDLDKDGALALQGHSCRGFLQSLVDDGLAVVF